jgi:hypothetical protein
MGASALERHVGVEEVRWKEIRLLVPNQSHGHPFFLILTDSVVFDFRHAPVGF